MNKHGVTPSPSSSSLGTELLEMLWGWDPLELQSPEHMHDPLPGAPCLTLPAQSCPGGCAAARESGRGCTPAPPHWQAAAGTTSRSGLAFFPRVAFEQRELWGQGPAASLPLFFASFRGFQDLQLVLQLDGGSGWGCSTCFRCLALSPKSSSGP